ncbi:MAG: hypothetical protein NUV69_04150 [Candidatus Curtissbacteria bacterium]|nr:hypothetical protein [Candidatus Curtissbacteria bacterium]
MSKNNIVFVINTNEYYRNYITSNCLSEIKADCTFLLNKDLTRKQIPQAKRDRVLEFSYSKEKARLHFHLFNTNTRRYGNRSLTFKFRFMRLPKFLKIKYSLLSFPVIYDLFKLYVFLGTKDKELEELIEKTKPSLILIPSSGFEGVTFEFIRIAKKYQIPVCLLIDNWDNLCSKTIFTRRPDYLAVWGKQSVEHTMRIHNVDRERVFVLGTPRFESYFRQRSEKLPSPYPFRFALFSGNAIPFDEISTLRELDGIISHLEDQIKIVYRPHPWRHPRKSFDTFFDWDFKNVILDTDARAYYKREQNNIIPGLDYYPRLLSNMEFMICPLSTMLIEGLIFNKKVFVITYDDGIHLTSPKNAFKYYEHFRKIEQLPNVIIVDKIEKLKYIFNNPNISNAKVNSKSKYSNLNYYLSEDTRNYSLNLKRLCETIIQKENEKTA